MHFNQNPCSGSVKLVLAPRTCSHELECHISSILLDGDLYPSWLVEGSI